MATWSKSTLADRVLRRLGVVGEGQSASSWQSNRTQEVIDSIYKEMRPRQLCPFLLTAITDWAQEPMTDIVAARIAPEFGYSGQRLAERLELGKNAEHYLARAVVGKAHRLPVKAEYY